MAKMSSSSLVTIVLKMLHKEIQIYMLQILANRYPIR